MAKRSLPTAKIPTDYELLAARLLKIINSPAAQKARHAHLPRHAGDVDADWQTVLDGLAETDNVTVAHRDDGGVDVFWVVAE